MSVLLRSAECGATGRYCNELKLTDRQTDRQTDSGRFVLPDIMTSTTTLDNEGRQLPSAQQNVTTAATWRAITDVDKRINLDIV